MDEGGKRVGKKIMRLFAVTTVWYSSFYITGQMFEAAEARLSSTFVEQLNSFSHSSPSLWGNNVLKMVKEWIREKTKPSGNGHDPFMGENIEGGYIPVGYDGSEMFYVLATKRQPKTEVGQQGTSESSTKPSDQGTAAAAEDDSSIPLVMWLTGGPGCSSEVALVKENGPFWLTEDGKLVYNKMSWTEEVHMLWIDQPLSTGYSIPASYADYSTNEGRISEFLRDFLLGFMDKYPNMKNRPFYIVGESYAGHYIPMFASRLLLDPIDGVKITGVALGDAWVDPIPQLESMPLYSYQNNLINDKQFDMARKLTEVCVDLIKRGDWPLAYAECNAVSSTIIGKHNPYNIKEPCVQPPVCYNMTSLDVFFNRDDVKQRLGAEKKWELVNPLVTAFLMGDWANRYSDAIASLLEKNVPVLVYVGELDFICNWIGSLMWTENLEWSRRVEFEDADLTPWTVEGKQQGEIKSIGPLTFLKLFGAGHMVPMDQPENALAMLREFVKNPKFQTAPAGKRFVSVPLTQ